MRLTLLFSIIFLNLGVFAQSIPNPSFENWSASGGYSDPVSWTTPNSTSYVFPFYVLTVTESSDAIEGTKSARLETKDIIGIPVPGLLTLGILTVNVFENTSSITGGIPYNLRPDRLTGNFKYSPATNDSLLIAVFMLKHNNVTGQLDTIGIGAFSSAETTTAFTAFEANIEYQTEDLPDTMNILIMSSDFTNPIVGSVLFVDNLAFSFDVGIEKFASENNYRIYPNPASDFVNIAISTDKNTEVKLFDIVGNILFTKVYSKGRENATIPLTNLPNGVYILEIDGKTSKIIKN
ncbi:MAG: T9SS type A sorting domain-containing protein [Bacteroidales bacterium]|nr:T9SS type A sorting domain-containing protein [Bacteroidales bacterium]